MKIFSLKVPAMAIDVIITPLIFRMQQIKLQDYKFWISVFIPNTPAVIKKAPRSVAKSKTLWKFAEFDMITSRSYSSHDPPIIRPMLISLRN